MQETEQAIADQIRRLRLAQGLSQEDLARRVSASGPQLHPTALTRIERGQRALSAGEFIRIANALGVSLAELASSEETRGKRAFERSVVESVEAHLEAGRQLERLQANSHAAMALLEENPQWLEDAINMIHTFDRISRPRGRYGGLKTREDARAAVMQALILGVYGANRDRLEDPLAVDVTELIEHYRSNREAAGG